MTSEGSDEEVKQVGTFEIFKAEGDILRRQKEYKKAIDSYTTGLEFKEGDRASLVSRSKCYLQLGDTKTALADAEAALVEDKTYHRGVYQKAEALYYMGNFEMALVFYHRGNKLRPELKMFQLGIHKAQEAIDNSVGSAKKVKLTTDGDLSSFADHDEKLKRRKLAFKTFSAVKMALRQTSKNKQFLLDKAEKSEKTIKQLLGELYGDRKYLEKLLKETDNSTEAGRTIAQIAEGGLWYLDTRSDFWRQQKPIYVRRYEMRQRRRKVPERGPSATFDYISKNIDKVEKALMDGEHKAALRMAKQCMEVVEQFSVETLPNKMNLIANLHSCIGNAYLEMGLYKRAEYYHHKDLELGKVVPLQEAKSRGLENLGRVYARMGNFEKAIKCWEKKIPMCTSDLELTWLYHEIGRCHLELGRIDQALMLGEMSLAAAEEIDDIVWKLQASVLTAQAHLRLNNHRLALDNFEKAMEFAKMQGDVMAQNAITKAIGEINRTLAEQLHDTGSEADMVSHDAAGLAVDSRASSNVAKMADNLAPVGGGESETPSFTALDQASIDGDAREATLENKASLKTEKTEDDALSVRSDAKFDASANDGEKPELGEGGGGGGGGAPSLSVPGGANASGGEDLDTPIINITEPSRSNYSQNESVKGHSGESSAN